MGGFLSDFEEMEGQTQSESDKMGWDLSDSGEMGAEYCETRKVESMSLKFWE